MAAQIYSGNQTTDYQPLTRNPQNNAAANLQPNQTALQPITSDQVNQQTLPSVTNLQVISNGTQQQASSDPGKSHSASVAQIGFVILLVALAAVIIYANKFKSRTKLPIVSESETSPLSAETEKPYPTKKKHNPRPAKKHRNRSAKKHR